jgi:peptidoglycan/xylan/chitin deacetylase (PgdA/CDA1 family)
MAITPANFAEQMHVLETAFHPCSLADLVAAAEGGGMRPRTVSVTFDDGYRDNLYEAMPLLERHGVPATVFVVTGYIESGRDFWWDVLERVCRTVAREGEFDGLYRAYHTELQALDHGERQAVLDQRADETGSKPPARVETMTTAELESIAASPLIDVGAHTVTHPLLSTLGAAEQLDEMRASKRYLEEVVGRPIRSFSYPFGSYDADSVMSVRTAGFSCACTSARRKVTAGTDVFELPRLPIGNWSGEELERKLSTWLADPQRSGGDS